MIGKIPQPIGVYSPLKAKTWSGVAGGVYTLINTLPLWNNLRDQLMLKKQFAFDTETNGLDFTRHHLIGMSFSWGAENSYYVPVRHETGCKQLQFEDIKPDLVEIFNRQDTNICFHNAKFDLNILLNDEIKVNGIVHDVLILHKLLKETGSAELKELANEEIDPKSDMWELAINDFRTKKAREKVPSPTPENPNRKVMRKKANVHYGMIPVNIMAPYAAADTHYTWALWKKKISLVAENSELRELYVMESKLLWGLLGMERKGALINREYLKTVGPEIDQQAKKYEDKIQKVLGVDVNVGSTKQLVEALKTKKIPLSEKTEKGNICLDSGILEKLALRYEVCADIVEFRKLKKLRSTYVDGIIKVLDKNDYLHTNYNQNVVTGRISSSKVNLQNVPSEDKTIRKAFICPKDYIMVLIDLSQIEIRISAHFSMDPLLLDAYNVSHRDVHTSTMCEVFGYDYDDAVAILGDNNHPQHEEMSQLRKVAKTTNFTVIYGGGPEALQLRISSPKKQYSKDQCRQFIDQYFAKLRGVKKWINKVSAQVLEDGYVQNYFGRYRRFPELHSPKLLEWERKRCQRQAVNSVIQSSSADLFKISMNRVDEILKETKSRSVLTIHDELVFYIHKEEMDVIGDIKNAMEDWHFRVPIVAEVSYATDNWAGKKSLHL